MNTFKDLIEKHDIKMECRLVDNNPHMTASDWEADHWSCTITYEDRYMQLYYSMGIGHREFPKKGYVPDRGVKLSPTCLAYEAREKYKKPVKPEFEYVLNCLSLDCSSVQGRFFSEWADEYGYSSDSIKAKETYDVCAEQAISLHRLLGNELYETMLYDTAGL